MLKKAISVSLLGIGITVAQETMLNSSSSISTIREYAQSFRSFQRSLNYYLSEAEVETTSGGGFLPTYIIYTWRDQNGYMNKIGYGYLADLLAIVVWGTSKEPGVTFGLEFVVAPFDSAGWRVRARQIEVSTNSDITVGIATPDRLGISGSLWDWLEVPKNLREVQHEK